MVPIKKEDVKYCISKTTRTVANGLVAIVTAIGMALAFIAESVEYRYKNDGDFRYYLSRIRDAIAIFVGITVAFAAVGEFIIYWAYGHPVIGLFIAIVMLIIDDYATFAMLNVDD